MAFNPDPSHWIPNWSEDGTNITVPIATFPELTAAEADATTGDIRKTLWAICEQLYARWVAIGADIPAKMTISRSRSLNDATGEITYNYTLRFVTEPDSSEVVAE